MRSRLLCLLALLFLALPVHADQWVKHNYLWTCKGEASLLIPGIFQVSQNAEGLLSLEDKTQNCYVGFALAQSEKASDRFLAMLRTRFKSTGPLKLGRTSRFDVPNAHRILYGREGQTMINKVPMYIAMGYFTNHKKYLAFLIFYPVAQKKLYEQDVLHVMQSARFK